jgi:hypothetical protein
MNAKEPRLVKAPLEKAFFQEQIDLLLIHSAPAVEAGHIFALFGYPVEIVW